MLTITIRGRLITPFILGPYLLSEHSDSSFVYGFMNLDYGLGTMTATAYSRLGGLETNNIDWLQPCSG